MPKKSFAVLRTDAGIELVCAGDTKSDAEAALARVRHHHPAFARFELVPVPMRGRVEGVPNLGDYSEADLAKLKEARIKEARRLKAARVAAGEEV
jgi:hypothetical protein